MQFAAPQELYKTPDNSFVAGFIGTMNFVRDCRGKDPNAIFFGQYTVKTAPGQAANHQGRSVTMAVRPEDIRLLRNHHNGTENIIQTKVNNVEFRGSLYRIYLQVMHQAGGLSDSTLEMDLQLKAVEDLGLRDGMELPIFLPPEKILLFGQQSAN